MFGHVVDSGAGKRWGLPETLLYHHWVSKRQTWRPRFLFSRAVPANAPGQNRKLLPKKKRPFCPQPFPHGLSCFHSSCSTSYRPVGHRLCQDYTASDFEVSLRPSAVNAKGEGLRERLKVGAGLGTAFQPGRARHH